MEIIYIPNAQDILAANKQKALTNKKIVNLHRLLYAGCILFVFASLSDLIGDSILSLFVLIIGFIAIFIVVALTPRIDAIFVCRATERMILKPECQALFAERKVELGDDKIKISSEQKNSEYQYNFIKILEISDELIHLIFADSSDFYIPTRVFQSVDKQAQFLKILNERISQKKGFSTLPE